MLSAANVVGSCYICNSREIFSNIIAIASRIGPASPTFGILTTLLQFATTSVPRFATWREECMHFSQMPHMISSLIALSISAIVLLLSVQLLQFQQREEVTSKMLSSMLGYLSTLFMITIKKPLNDPPRKHQFYLRAKLKMVIGNLISTPPLWLFSVSRVLVASFLLLIKINAAALIIFIFPDFLLWGLEPEFLWFYPTIVDDFFSLFVTETIVEDRILFLLVHYWTMLKLGRRTIKIKWFWNETKR